MSKLVEHRELWSGLVNETDASVGILGIPFDNAVSWRGGTKHAPDRLRSLTPHLGFYTEEGVRLKPCIQDYGNVENNLNWTRFFERVELEASALLNKHKLSLFLGGDHSIGIPIFKAFKSSFAGSVGYIQFDSHTDLIDEFEGHKWSHACTAKRNVDNGLQPEHLAFVGLRSYLTEEIAFRDSHPETGWYTARDVYKEGVNTIAEKLISQFKDVDAVYFSLDIDGLDPAYAPGTGTPEAGGLSTRDCLELLRSLFAHLPIKAMDIVEVSPPLDTSDVTSLAALKIIYEVLGFVQSKETLT